ncbi:MAG: Abi family protein [Sarcina sp.]
MKEGKSINSLMKHMRDKHNIQIGTGVERGGRHKIELQNFGYYHGFKAYKFVKTTNNRLNISNFNEIVYINQFDMELKGLIYPKIMFLESAIKNHTLVSIFDHTKKIDFDSIYNELLTSYKEKFISNAELNRIRDPKLRKKKENDYKLAINRRLRLRSEIYKSLNTSFDNDVKVIQHFYNNHRDVPIWATFEVLMMGNLGNFISCLKLEVRDQLSKSLNLNLEFDGNREFSWKIIYILKDLRNAVAHNNVIFDARFKTGFVNKNLIRGIISDTGVQNIDFDGLVDYIVLIVYLLKGLKVSKTELKRFVGEFERILNSFREQMTISNYNKIINTNTRNKIKELNEYISK